MSWDITRSRGSSSVGGVLLSGGAECGDNVGPGQFTTADDVMGRSNRDVSVV